MICGNDLGRESHRVDNWPVKETSAQRKADGMENISEWALFNFPEITMKGEEKF